MDAKEKAEQAFQQAMHTYEATLEAEKEHFDGRLQDPEHNRLVGLPEYLPEEARKILRHTMAADKLAHCVPNRRTFYDKFGVK